MDDDNGHGLPSPDVFSEEEDWDLNPILLPEWGDADDLFELFPEYDLENIQIGYIEVEPVQEPLVDLPNGVQQNEVVHHGLREEVILGALEQCLYHKENAEDEDEECTICLQAFAEGDAIGKLECGHFNHFECITEWLTHKNICTLCGRKALNVEGDN